MFAWAEKRVVLNWITVIIIAVTIFYLSSKTFPPGKPGINILSYFYHFLAFFWLSFFLSLALVKGKEKGFMMIVIMASIFYALSDEFHQLFVPGRACSLSDFLIDSGGIFLASFIYLIRMRKA